MSGVLAQFELSSPKHLSPLVELEIAPSPAGEISGGWVVLWVER